VTESILGGPMFWYASRALGVTAYVALTLEVLLGLSASTGALDRLLGRAQVIDLHRWLSTIALATLGAHAAVLLADRTVSMSLVDLLVPFVGPYRPFATGLGVLAAWLALIVHGSFWLRKRIGGRAWRALHFATFAVFVAATFHGLLAGTDRAWLGLRLLYAGAAAAVATLVFVRLGLLLARPALQRKVAGR
jgi:sulfoxide reductase heme-binding subunit YedZ